MINTERPDYVIFQEQEEGIPEAALLIKKYEDCFSLIQKGDDILINYESIKELIKVLWEVYHKQGATK